MKLPHVLRHLLWQRKMRSYLKSAKNVALPSPFSPKRCIVLFDADQTGWEQLFFQKKQAWPSQECDFAFIGYSEKESSSETIGPPFHFFDQKMLGPSYELPAAWLGQWSRQTDVLLVANPAAQAAIDLLAAQLPAFFKASIYATEFGELYGFVLQSGPEQAAERLKSLQVYLQKIMQL